MEEHYWYRIPQKTYNRRGKQWNFIPLEDISFRINGRPGVNMGGALRKGVVVSVGRMNWCYKMQAASLHTGCRYVYREDLHLT